MSKPNGGPAFPDVQASGMSLRDWFAGQAMAGLICHIQNVPETEEACVKAVNGSAAFAYIVADAMLAERAK